MELGYGTLRIRYRETATNLSNVVYIEYDIIKTLLEKRYYNNINWRRDFWENVEEREENEMGVLLKGRREVFFPQI